MSSNFKSLSSFTPQTQVAPQAHATHLPSRKNVHWRCERPAGDTAMTTSGRVGVVATDPTKAQSDDTITARNEFPRVSLLDRPAHPSSGSTSVHLAHQCGISITSPLKCCPPRFQVYYAACTAKLRARLSTTPAVPSSGAVQSCKKA